MKHPCVFVVLFVFFDRFSSGFTPVSTSRVNMSHLALHQRQCDDVTCPLITESIFASKRGNQHKLFSPFFLPTPHRKRENGEEVVGGAERGAGSTCPCCEGCRSVIYLKVPAVLSSVEEAECHVKLQRSAGRYVTRETKHPEFPALYFKIKSLQTNQHSQTLLNETIILFVL